MSQSMIFLFENGCSNFSNDFESREVLDPRSILNDSSIGFTELQSLPSIQDNNLIHRLYPSLSFSTQNFCPLIVFMLDAKSILQS